MKYANINTQEIRDDLPPVLVLGGTTITGATIAQWATRGWRTVTQVDQPAEGYRVTQYTAQEIDTMTCRLAVTSSVNIANETAANLAATTAAQKSDAKATVDSGAYDVQRALRAFAALTLQEINTLRTKAGMATYTWAQFVTALKNKIDEQT